MEEEQEITFKVVNDPVHGHIKLHPLLVKIIDTPQFQRLRFIKQLGAASFVYPGATHTRFDHSIGVAHLAGELAETLRRNQPELNITEVDVLCVKIAGLCHDLGHGPFSHLFDGLFIPKVLKQKWTHEEASLKMFDHMVENNNLIQEMEKYDLKVPEDLRFIKKMIHQKGNGDHGSGKCSECGKCCTYCKCSQCDKCCKCSQCDKCCTYCKCSRSGKCSQCGKCCTCSNCGKCCECCKCSTNHDDDKKPFLFEIVANKTNGIDVDKFDYFARDCHYLGIQNNFNHHRFLMFARVCDVKGEEGENLGKHICTRDKELHNLYNMFYTRSSLHRRAYQHKVVNNIQIMIADAFLKADEHIKIKGSGGKEFTLSGAIDDMEAYTKLTDKVFEDILYSSSDELMEARKILQSIIERKFYRCLGQWKGVKPKPDDIDKWKEELAEGQDGLLKDDFEIPTITIDYGKGEENPMDTVYVYTKDKCKEAKNASKEEMSMLLPVTFCEKTIMVYFKKSDEESLKKAERSFDAWYSKRRRNKDEPEEPKTRTRKTT